MGKQAEKLINLERKVGYHIMILIFLILIYLNGYRLITGKSVPENVINSIIICGLIFGFVLVFYLVIIFPRKYPSDFLQYKKHAKQKYNFPKFKLGLKIMFIVLIPFYFILMYTFYRFGFETLEEIWIAIGFTATLILFAFVYHFIHLLET
jgi:hypothetical protein